MNKVRPDYPWVALSVAAMVALSGCIWDDSNPTEPEMNMFDQEEPVIGEPVDTRSQTHRLLNEAGLSDTDLFENALAALYAAMNLVDSDNVRLIDNTRTYQRKGAGDYLDDTILRASSDNAVADIVPRYDGENLYFIVERDDAGYQWVIDTETDNPETLAIDGTNGIVLVKTFDDADTNTETGRDGTVLVYAMSDIENDADTDYLSAAVWVFIPEDLANAAASDYVVGAVAKGTDPYSNDETGSVSFPALTGTATFVGPAIGVYTYAEDDVAVGAGGFTAEVDLIANFNPNNAPTEHGKITGGNIGNFKFDNGESFGFTTINLSGSALNFDNQGQELFTGTVGPTRSEWDGDYSGQFFGEQETFPGSGHMEPASIAGTFSAVRTWDGNGNDMNELLNLLGAFNLKPSE